MPDSTVNWAEVADKAIDVGASAVAELSELVKGVAPEVWEIAVRQVYAGTIGNLLGWSIVAIALYVILMKSFRKMEKSSECSRESITCGVVLSIAGIFSVFAGINLVSSLLWLIKALINPSYYAIKLIADMI